MHAPDDPLEIVDCVREPLDVGDILNRAVERLGATLEVSRCVALLPQENGEYREYVWTDPRFALPADAILWESCPVVQRLEETGQPLVVPDAAETSELCELPDDVVPPRSLLGLPAVSRRDGATGRRPPRVE